MKKETLNDVTLCEGKKYVEEFIRKFVTSILGSSEGIYGYTVTVVFE